jgi:hypothetical protein
MGDVFQPARVSGQQCGALPLLSAKPSVFLARISSICCLKQLAMKLCLPDTGSKLDRSCGRMPCPGQNTHCRAGHRSLEALMLGMSDENVYGDGWARSISPPIF